jgi:molybdopterin-guanine dinucleotide biosynthesis protein A
VRLALVRREVLDDLADYLGSGGRRMQDWYRRLRMTTVDFPETAAFRNINTPQDLAAGLPS